MALVQATLAAELKGLSLYDNEPAAISGWAGAFTEYFKGASSNGVTIVPAALLPAEAAMTGALTGLSVDAATALQLGLIAFWGAIVPAVAWPTVTAIVPPVLLAGIGALLTTTFTANTVGKLDKDPCMDAIAAVIHPNNLGGTAAWPTPILVQPIL